MEGSLFSSYVNYVERIAYNAKGQQLLVAYGNGIMTRFLYRTDNFRLLRLKSEKYTKSGLIYTPNSGIKQNYSYQYDLSGNIINITDTTTNCGYGATPDALSRKFIYDALYRLLSATGRETAATGTTPWDDLYRPENESVARGYTQQYDYDKLGNIQELQHIATSGNFTRSFDYGSFTKNALQKITIGSNVYHFAYDVNGNMLSEGDTARHLEYDCADRLRCFYVQTGSAEPSKYTHYLYDGAGNRVKKITRKQGGKYTATTYIDGAFEYTKESTGFDGIPNLKIGTWKIGSYSSGGEQNILNIMGGATRLIGASLGDSTPAIKYNLSDHLGSSCVQLDTSGTTVSLEEYYPFGETSFGSYAKKRYRFCGKEKDEESGLYYYGMRYYSPWTCRFINVDPLAGKYAHLTPYAYADNKPINHTDLDGAETGSTPPTPQSGSNGGAPANQLTNKTTTNTNTANSLYVTSGSTANTIKANPYQPAEKLPFYHQQGGNMGTDLANANQRPTPTLQQQKAAEPEKVNIKITSPVLTQTKKPTTVSEVITARENKTKMYWDQVRSEPNSIWNKSNYFRTDLQLARAAGDGLVIGAEAAASELAVSKFADFYKMYQLTRKGELVAETVPVIAHVADSPIILKSLQNGDNIALGVREYLDDFAKSVNGRTWKDWGTDNFETQFLETINNSSNKIHFNLDGIGSNNAWAAVTEGSKDIQNGSRITSWELYQIYSNPSAAARTTFYEGGQIVPNPFK